MNSFDAYITVDWSAANTATTGANSIWIAFQFLNEPLMVQNHATRFTAMEAIGDLITRTQGRILIGLDFSFAYPAAGIKALGCARWDDLWRLLSDLIEDDATNRNNRFEVAANLNKRMGFQEGPFWGHPPSRCIAGLGSKKPKPEPLPPLRTTENGVARAQSAWKLAYTGSVGSQTLMGIPHLWHLRQKLKQQTRDCCIWPFEALTNSRNEVVIAELYHSLFEFDAKDPIRDRAQVVGSLKALSEGDLSSMLKAGHAQDIARLEGWTLGVF